MPKESNLNNVTILVTNTDINDTEEQENGRDVGLTNCVNVGQGANETKSRIRVIRNSDEAFEIYYRRVVI